jgi:hypothetical protein
VFPVNGSNTSRLLENWVLRKTFGPEMEEVNRGWTELYGEKLHNLSSSSDIVRNNKNKAIKISINIK